MFRIKYLCHLELSEILHDNTKVRSVEDMTKLLQAKLTLILGGDIDVKITEAEATTSLPFD